jgi:hypothetical protein
MSMQTADQLSTAALGVATALCLSAISAAAQPLRLQWAQTGGGRYDDWANVALDASDGVVVAGAISSPASFGGSTLSVPPGNLQDIFLARLRSSGEPVWAITSGGELIDAAHSVAVTPSGQILIGGFFRDELVFFGGPTLTSAGDPTSDRSRDAFVASFGADGSLRWVKQGGDIGLDAAVAVAIGRGAGLASGQLQRGARFDGISTHAAFLGSFFVSRHSLADGAVGHVAARGLAHGFAIAPMPDGGYVVAGELLGNTDFGNGFPRAPRGGVDAFVARYDADNELVFVNTSGGTGEDGAFGVAVGADARIFVAGQFIGDLTVRPGLVFSSRDVGMPYADGFVLCLEADGSPCWGRQIESDGFDAAFAVAAASDGSVAVTGTMGADPRFGEWRGIVEGDSDAFVARYRASDGALLSVLPIGGGGDATGESVAIDSRGDLVVGGYFARDIRLPDRTVTATETDLFVAKVIVAPVVSEDAAEEDDDLASAVPITAGWTHSHRCPAWLARLVSATERCEGIFLDAGDTLPDGSAGAPPRAAEEVWSTRVSGRTLTHDADFFRVVLPDPAVTHPNINPASPPGPAEPLPECGSVERRDLPVALGDRVDVNIAGRLSIRIVPDEDGLEGRGVQPTEPVALYHDGSRVTDFSDSGPKGWTVYCPRSRLGIVEARFSVGEGVTRSDFDRGAYSVELEYVLEINRGVPDWVLDAPHLFGRGFLPATPPMPGEPIDVFGRIEDSPLPDIGNCFADGPACWDLYVLIWPGGNEPLEVDSRLSPGMTIQLVDAERKVIAQAAHGDRFPGRAGAALEPNRLSAANVPAGKHYLLVGGAPGRYQLSYRDFAPALPDAADAQRPLWATILVLVAIAAIGALALALGVARRARR